MGITTLNPQGDSQINSTSCTLSSYDTQSITDGILIAAVEIEDPTTAPTIDDVTFGGTGLTLAVSEIVSNGSFDNRIEIWYLLGATGTGDIVATFSAQCDNSIINAVVLKGAKQQAPEATATNEESSASSISTAITTLTDGALVLDAVGHQNATDKSVTEGANGQVEIIETLETTGGASSNSVSIMQGGVAGSKTLGWDPTTGRWVHVLTAWEREDTPPLGRWVGGDIVSGNLPEAWTAPNGLFPTEDRNDGGLYDFASATSTLTLPASGLADGYLFIAHYEFEDDSNGRFNPQGQIVQASGTGTFVGAPAGGFSRDASEDRAFVTCWAFVDGPSASATFQFQWKADADDADATSGTVTSHFSAIPLYYSDAGIYSSTNAGLLGGTTRTVIPGWSGTDGTNITLSADAVSVTGDNKRYLILGGWFFEGREGRTQRICALEYDGVADAAAQAYAYYRLSGTDENGGIILDLIETATATRTIEMSCYRGPSAVAEGAADIDGSTPGVGDHALVVLELNDSAEVYRANDGTGGQRVSTTATPVDLNIARTAGIDFNDAASFTRETDSAVNVEVAADVLFGANIFAARSGGVNANDGLRLTSRARGTVNGTEDPYVAHGNYLRGENGSQDTWAVSYNPVGFADVQADDNIGVSVQAITGTEGANDAGNADETLAGSVGFWAVNIHSLEETSTTATRTLALDGALQAQLSLTTSLNAALAQRQLAAADVDAALAAALSQAADLDAAVAALLSATTDLDAALSTRGSATVNLDAGLAAAKTRSAALDAALAMLESVTTALGAGVQQGQSVDAAIDAVIRDAQSLATNLQAVIATGVATTTSLDAGLAALRSLQADLDAAVQARPNRSASLDAALAIAQAALANLDAVLAIGQAASLSLDAALAVRQTRAAALDAALRQGRTAALSLSAALAEGRSGTAQMDATLATGGSALAAIDAAILRVATISLGLEAAVEKFATASVALQAALRSGESLDAALDAALRRTVAIATALDAFVQSVAAGATVSLGLEALLQAVRPLETSLQAALQAVQQAAATLDAAVAEDRALSLALSAGLADARSLAISLDTVLARSRLLIVSLSAAIRARQLVALGIDAALGLPFAPRAPHKVPPRSGQSCGVGSDGRVYVIPPRDTIH